MQQPYPILSIRPIFAYQVLRDGKDIENRTWKTSYRGSLYIHVSKTFESTNERLRFYARFPDTPIGGVAGIVELVDCVRDHPSRWAMPDCWHWVLVNPREVEFVQMKGKLGLFYDVTTGRLRL